MTGGGRRKRLVITPSTEIMITAFDKSDSAHVIPGGVDSYATETILAAKRRRFNEPIAPTAVCSPVTPSMLSTVPTAEHNFVYSPGDLQLATVNSNVSAPTVNEEEVYSAELDRSVDEDNSRSPMPRPPHKRRRKDARTTIKALAPLSSKLDALRKQLLKAEIAKAEAQRELAKFELYRTKLVIYELCKNMTNAEVQEANSMTIPDEQSFADGTYYVVLQ